MGLRPEAATIAIAPLLRAVVKADWGRIGLNEPNGKSKPAIAPLRVRARRAAVDGATVIGLAG